MSQFAELLQSQIKSHCQLALPEGLKELMSDISREVLRAQPKNIYGFITKYLAALLVSRENLAIASRVCQNVCQATCHPELEIILKEIGLDDEDVIKAKEIIDNYFEEGGAQEETLMRSLMANTKISKNQFEPLQYAIRDAFLEHQLNKADQRTIKQSGTGLKMPSDEDEISRAATHTLELYAQTGPSEEEYNQNAIRIQAAYRAQGVRRLCSSKPGEDDNTMKNIHFLTQMRISEVPVSEESETSESSGSGYSISSLYDEKEVSAMHFIEPDYFSAGESKVALKAKLANFANDDPNNDQTDHSSVIPKVNFNAPLYYEISKDTIPEDLKEDSDLFYDEKRNDLRLARNSHNILEDVIKRNGDISHGDGEFQDSFSDSASGSVSTEDV